MKKKSQAVRGVSLSIVSDDVDIETWQPETRDDVYTTLAIQIGDSADDSSDLFYVKIATPEGLRKHSKNGIISTRGLLVISDFDYVEITEEIRKIIESSVDHDWTESVRRLQRYFIWEYEGMSSSTPS
jgi:hypothetical protein